MDFFSEFPQITDWLVQYGSLFLFIAFALGILILPVPEETMMLLAGILIRNGTLPLFSTALGAFLGSLCGITLSYTAGKFIGGAFLEKYGKWVGFTKPRIQKAHLWFHKRGKWSLVIGYFIPGVRHFTGLSAGITKLEWRQFALYAYLGASLWVSTFLFVGYHMGYMSIHFFNRIEFVFDRAVMLLLAGIVAAILCFLFYKKMKK